MRTLKDTILESMGMNKNIANKLEERDKSILNVKVNTFEEAVDIFAKYFGIDNYKISDSSKKDKSYNIGPNFYTKDKYDVNKYIQFMIGKIKPANARFTISKHGNNLVIQIIYYNNNRITDYTWAYGLYDKNKYKYGEETLLKWLQRMSDNTVDKNNYKHIIQEFN